MYSFKKVTHKLRKAISPSQTISTFQLSKSKQTTHCYFFQDFKMAKCWYFFLILYALSHLCITQYSTFSRKKLFWE